MPKLLILKGKIMLKRSAFVKKQGFGGSQKIMFFDQKVDVKKHDSSAQISPRAALGSVFWILGGFGRGRFFDGFWDRKKWVQNLVKSDKSSPEG